MRDDELTNIVIKYLDSECRLNRSRPRYFLAKQVADEVGGYAPSVGRVSESVVRELRARGHKVEYQR